MNKLNQKGATTLIYMSLLSIIAVLVLSLSYSRMLLALKRGTSFSDNLIANYKAESEVNDILAKLAGGFIDFDDFPLNLNFTTDNGTKVEVIGTVEGDKQNLIVTASRTFAVSRIKAVRTVASSSESDIEGVEIAMALDCTSSMNSKAIAGGPKRPTRIEALETATLSFIDTIKDHPQSDKFKLGISVFKVDSAWLKMPSGQFMTPDANIPIDVIRSEVDRQFTDPSGNGDSTRNEACKQVTGGTSIGSGLALINTYYRNTPPTPKVKRVQIIVSDGFPNSRMPYERCQPSGLCTQNSGPCKTSRPGWNCLYQPNDPAKCSLNAHDFVRCTAAPTSETWVGWMGSGPGDRDPSVDLYGVLVFSGLEDTDEIVQILDKYATEHYTTANATELGGIFDDIFKEISSSVSTIVISREVPTD